MNFSERMVAVARAVLAGGPMGNKKRGDEYRDFIRCDFPLAAAMANGGDIGSIKTSCGVFAGAVMHHAGFRRDKKPRWAGPLLNNWIPIGTSHESWEAQPFALAPGDVFFVGNLHGINGHVGVILGETDSGFWETAEGGGAPDGTTCSIRKRHFNPYNLRSFDSRGLAGVFRAEVLNASAGSGSARYLSQGECHG